MVRHCYGYRGRENRQDAGGRRYRKERGEKLPCAKLEKESD